MLKARILTALALLSVLLVALFLLPDPYWALLLLCVTTIGAGEWSRLAAYSRTATALYVGSTCAIGMLLLFGATTPGMKVLLFASSALFWLMIAPLWLKRKWDIRHPLVLAAVGWLVLIPTWLALIELRAASPWLLLGILALVWVADSAAYFAGRRFGKHKLAPSVSPGKTWEGAAGGFIAVALYGLMWREIAPGILVQSIGLLWWMASLGALTALSIVGDLFESWMKRRAGLKDSGQLLPGHGGVLDRIDALTATLPLATLALFATNLLEFR